MFFSLCFFPPLHGAAKRTELVLPTKYDVARTCSTRGTEDGERSTSGGGGVRGAGETRTGAAWSPRRVCRSCNVRRHRAVGSGAAMPDTVSGCGVRRRRRCGIVEDPTAAIRTETYGARTAALTCTTRRTTGAGGCGGAYVAVNRWWWGGGGVEGTNEWDEMERK